MPVISSSFDPCFIVRFGHVQTILPNLIRKVNSIPPETERIDTPDGDFLDMDWYKTGAKRLMIVSHGLEGNSRRLYIRGMAKKFYENGFDVLAWNFRSCSLEMNRKPSFYHSGYTEDLKTIIHHVLSTQRYNEIVLVGFSMGGNITLKYLGEEADQLPAEIKSAVAISVPVDLASCSAEMAKWSNKIYMARFIRQLGKKIAKKSKMYPELMHLENYHEVKNFKDFDDRYTSKLSGFKDAEDYWTKASSLPYLPKINIPFLLINAKNDSFLGEICYPYDLASAMPNFYLETPDSGGHCGFMNFKPTLWSENRAYEFIISQLTQ